MTKEPQEETYQTLENKALEEFYDKFQGWKNTKLDFITGEVEWTKAREINYIVCSKKKVIDFLKSHLQLAFKDGVTSERERIRKWAEKEWKYSFDWDTEVILIDDLLQELQNK